ncbi:MAG: SulP family inorganic anion transporter [Gammaproteobacteria bacterium]|nr:SulP family inorganic anion transporter [Gammaproteobacteria bacterium]
MLIGEYTNCTVNYNFRTLKGDLLGGITATVVVLPAALAFGLASGLGAAAGLYGSIAVGLFAALFGGTRSQISGATGPMTVAMAVIVTSHASTLGEALIVVVMGGLLQVLLGLSKLGRFVAYTPHVVVSGFMSGIGIIIVLIQILPFFGLPAAGGPVDSIHALPSVIDNINPSALAIAAITLAIALAWPHRLSAYLPATVLALVVGTLVRAIWLTDAPVIGALTISLPELHFELPSADFLIDAVEPALILALLASVDSLLTSLTADSVTGNRHDPNKELVGQGLGNMAAGLVGGLPGGGNTLGTLTNVRAGGTTRVSGVIYAGLLLAIVLVLGGYLQFIPHAVLAGIVIKIALDIVDWRMLSRLHRLRSEHLVVLLTTLSLTVFVDLVTAVVVGLIAAGMAHARQLERLELDSVVSVPLLDSQFLPEGSQTDSYAARAGLLALKGSFTVASSQRLVAAITPDIREHDVLIFDFSNTTYVDDSAAMVIEHLMDVAREEETEFIVQGMSAKVERTFRTLNVLRGVPEARIVDTADEARELVAELLAA